MNKEPMPHDVFIKRLQALINFLKLKNKMHLQTVNILLNDNMHLHRQIQEMKGESSNEQGSKEEGK